MDSPYNMNVGCSQKKMIFASLFSVIMTYYVISIISLKHSKNEMFYMDPVDVHYNLHTLLTPYLLVVASRSHVLNMLASHWIVAASSGHMPLLLCKNYSTSVVSISNISFLLGFSVDDQHAGSILP